MRRTLFLILCVVVFGLAGFSADAARPEAKDPAETWLYSNVKTLLSASSVPGKENRDEQIEKTVGEMIDLDDVARISTGRYWRSFSEPQKKQYRAVFRKQLMFFFDFVFSLDIEQVDSAFSITKVARSPDYPQEAIVYATYGLEYEGEGADKKDKLLFSLHFLLKEKTKKAYEIKDILVEGNSLLFVLRDTMVQRIAGFEGNFDELLKSMEETGILNLDAFSAESKS